MPINKDFTMNRHVFAGISLALILFAVCSTPSNGLTQSSPEQAHLISPDAYGHILDIVFSREAPDAAQLQYSFVLRFMSSRHTESEAAISVLRNGMVQARFSKVAGPSVWDVANDYIHKTGDTDVQQIAKLIHITKQVLPVSSSQAALWYAGLMRSMAQSSTQLQQETATFKKTGETTIFLDGSTYELWFQQGLTQVHWTVMDEEVDDASTVGRSFIAKWMNEVRRYAVSHVTY
jgi:hypothetical protein